MKILLALFALFIVAHGQVVLYSAWSTCAANCQQNRTVTGCVGPLCAAPYNGPPFNPPQPAYPYGDPNRLGLTCQSCVGDACPAGSTLPTSWQGVYSVKTNRCQPGPALAPSAYASTCCCFDENNLVNVRQYDELVEITFPDGVSMSGNGCNVVRDAGLSGIIPESARFFPKGVSFKVVNPDALGGVNAGTYVNGAPAKSSGTPIPGTNAPSTIKSAGTVTLFGRAYRAILTCNSIYFFGLAGFSATDNPLCVQELNKVAELASY